MQKYFNMFPGTPPVDIPGDYRYSVHYGNSYRLDKAREQYSLSAVDVDDIIMHTNTLLREIGMVTTKEPRVFNPLKINYEKVKQDCGLLDIRDIVWMKFIRSGHLGVVATSNDITFDMPQSKADYDKRVLTYDPYKRRNKSVWKHTSSGILVHQLHENWDTSFVLVFPLANFPEEYARGDIERAIGNYLIDKQVPIIDFYSHNY